MHNFIIAILVWKKYNVGIEIIHLLFRKYKIYWQSLIFSFQLGYTHTKTHASTNFFKDDGKQSKEKKTISEGIRVLNYLIVRLKGKKNNNQHMSNKRKKCIFQSISHFRTTFILVKDLLYVAYKKRQVNIEIKKFLSFGERFMCCKESPLNF